MIYCKEKHFVHRSNWIRAAVLGANDGIISISCLVIGVAAATYDSSSVVISSIAALFAGALSMAAGEYISVSSQTDIEKSDIERERHELINDPEGELRELAHIYEKRGLDEDLAMQVAKQMTDHDALESHTRDELGITEVTQARPITASIMSALSFAFGGMLPIIGVFFFNAETIIPATFVITILSLALLGLVSANIGGSKASKSILRIVLWGLLAMLVTLAIGNILNSKFIL